MRPRSCRCTGFIRVPDLTWGHIGHPSEVVGAGQRITAEVIVVDTRSGQVTLSLKRAGGARC
ncbi:S1 RNA-binding domain-containing protein [Streptomyces pseudogriseolus]|uniref:S1 RNA-binding domain-containing protein n=1 Tax=Streptomyces pseudogriseolus TaxID=36817 RepID=UPI003FA279FD